METHPVIMEAKIGNCSIEFKSCANLFVLFAHEFILLYFFKKTISCFIHIFYSKFLTYVFLRHDYIFSDTVLLVKQWIFNIPIDSSSLNIFYIPDHVYCKQYKDFFFFFKYMIYIYFFNF